MKARLLFLFAAYLAVCANLVSAGDWPQWRGPERTGVSAETGLLKQWPQEGPKPLWKATGLGSGYSTPSVVNEHIYLMGTKSGDEQVIALDARDGKQVWSSKVGPIASAGYSGPRGTPTVDGELLYTLGSDSDLVCMKTATGEVVWRKNLQKDFGGRRGKWAYAESPLIDGEVLVCTPGGAEATILALNKKTGEVIWKSAVPGGDAAAYSSVIIAQVGPVKQYVQFLARGVVGVEAKTGKFLWRYSKTANGTANIPTPIFHDNYVFSASGYRTGGGLVKLAPDKEGISAAEVYFTKDMVNHHGGVVRVGDHLYGTNENSLVCLDFKTGAKKWQADSVGKGSVTYADGHLYVRSENGPIALVEATPAGYKEKGRFSQPDRSRQKAWPHPVVANGKLYIRDQDALFCYDIKEAK